MTPAVVAYLRDAAFQTIGITCASFVIAVMIGVPLGVLVAREDRLGRALAAAVAVVRAIPELVLAIVAVVAVGLGPIAGIVALGAHYAAVLAKFTADHHLAPMQQNLTRERRLISCLAGEAGERDERRWLAHGALVRMTWLLQGVFLEVPDDDL